jgi:hypothetical protein
MYNTKVKFYKTEERVKIEMDLKDYKSLLELNNFLQDQIRMMHETSTIYLSDLGKFEEYELKMARILDFRNMEGHNHFCDYVLSNDPKARQEKA